MGVKKGKLLDDNLHYSSKPDYRVYELRLSNLISEAVSLGFSAILIDQYFKTIKLIHYNPKLKTLGDFGVYDIEESYITDLINDSFHIPIRAYFSAVNMYLKSIKKNDCFQLSFNTTLTKDDLSENVELKFIPYVYHTVNQNTLWLTFCLIQPTDKTELGRFIYRNIDTKKIKYIVFEDMNETDPAVSHLISQEEIDIINYTADGFTEAEIAKMKKVSLSTLKNSKNYMISRLNAKSIIHALVLVRKQGF